MSRLILSILLASSCAGLELVPSRDAAGKPDPALLSECDDLERRLAEAAAQGAVRCAPEDYGVARTNDEFARMELAHGNERRAKEHLQVAGTAVLRALEKSRRCAPLTSRR